MNFDDRPLVTIWEVTQACDLACKHCRAEADPDRHPNELTTAEGRSLLDGLSEFGEDQLVVLSGGDPTARPDLESLIEYGTDIGLAVTLTPSGTSSLTPTRVRRLADAGVRRMALSIDGATAPRHDEFRQQVGSFEQTISAARAARAADLPLQVNTTVCAETVDELPAIRDLVEDLGAVMWSVFFLVPVGRGQVLDPISPTTAESVLRWLADVADSADFALKTTEAPHYRRVRHQRRSQPASQQSTPRGDRRNGVIAGDGFVFVSHTGEVYPSGFLPVSVGNVRNRPITELYRDTPLMQRLRDRSNLRGKCGACEFQDRCGGSRSRAFAHTGDPLAADPLCAYVPTGYDGPMPAHLDGSC